MSIHDIHVPTLYVEAKSFNASPSDLVGKLAKDSKTERIPTSKRSTPRPKPRYKIKPKSSSVVDIKIKGTRAFQAVNSTPSTKFDDENRSNYDTLAEKSKQLPNKSSSAKTLDYLRTPIPSRPRPNSARPKIEITSQKLTNVDQDYSSEIQNNPQTARHSEIKYRSVIINGQIVQILQALPSPANESNGLRDYSINPGTSRPSSASRSSSGLLRSGYGLNSSSTKSRSSKAYLSPSDRNKIKLKYERLNVMYSSPYGKPIRGKKIAESSCGTRYIPIQKYYLKPYSFFNDKISTINSPVRTKIYISPKPF